MRFRFTIRDWFLLVVTLAVALCWMQREFRSASVMAEFQVANAELAAELQRSAAERARLEKRIQNAADAWKGQVAAVGAELRAIQATKTRNAELEKRFERLTS